MDPFPARDNLLALYEKNRSTCQSMTYEDFMTVQRTQGVRALFDMHRIKLQVLPFTHNDLTQQICQGMLDTRISLEQFEPLMTLTTNCLQTMMDLGKVF